MLFESGVKLSDRCRKILENAERKIKTLTECEAENG
ncbi:MAG: exodeoxyribonuclease VII small subunit [Clostridia bacterium]|nr:exodeoxyribonuclease VII small subunit [Clostridia bacterium]